MPQARLRYIEAATRLFMRDGFNGVSMRDLADELGVQAPSIYSHFPAKEDILVAVATPTLDRCQKVVDAAPAEPTVSTRRDWLCQFLDWLSADGRRLSWMVNEPAALQHPVLGPRMLAIHRQLREIIQSFDVERPQAARSIVGYLAWPYIAPWGEPPVTTEERDRIVNEVEALIEYAHTQRGKRP